MFPIQLMQLSFAYDGHPVLEKISLSIRQGERVALLGPNGAGKSTLLKLMSGVLTPSEGFVLLDGRSARSTSRMDLARKIAVVPQEVLVPFSFSVREIVEFGRTPHLRMLGTLCAPDRRAIKNAMEVTATTHLRERVFNELSGGERQRVMIAMALAQEPELLLLDEPTQQLDVSWQAGILDLITELNLSQRLTVVAAIHDLNLASRYFGRLAFLHRGTLFADGTPEDVLRVKVLESVYASPLEIFQSPSTRSPVVLPIPRCAIAERKP